MARGKLIVFDGNDGSGKQTQMLKIVERLEKEGHKVRTLDFPQYDNNFFGHLIGEGQTGAFGKWTELPSKLISITYAADRFESKDQIESWLSQGYTVFLDRYVSANQIHQGGKIHDVLERRDFLGWLSKMEYEVFKIPKPSHTFYFDVSINTSFENLKKKKPERYKAGQEDQTENDRTYLENSRECALWMASQNNTWTLINCMDEESMRSIEDIHEEVYENLTKNLL